MKNNSRLPPCNHVNVDDPISITYIVRLSDKDYREEIWRIFIELKESMERAERASNNKKDIKVVMRKLLTEITGLITWLAK